MLSGDFQLKLRKCNPKLRIYSGDSDTRPAGIYHVSDPEMAICGIDKNFVPEWPRYDTTGRIVKGGWKRALRLLIEEKYIDRRRAEQVFGSQIIGTRRPPYLGATSDHIQDEIEASKTRGYEKYGKESVTRDEVMDIASEIQKKR